MDLEWLAIAVGLRDRLVFLKLLDENIWLSSVAPAEDRPCVFVKEPDLVIFLTVSSEIGTVTVIDQRKNTALTEMRGARWHRLRLFAGEKSGEQQKSFTPQKRNAGKDTAESTSVETLASRQCSPSASRVAWACAAYSTASLPSRRCAGK